jgi:hypothetical protein
MAGEEAEMLRAIDGWIRYLIALRANVAAGAYSAAYPTRVERLERGHPDRRADR